MAKRNQENPDDWDESLFPKMIIKDGKPFITDGYIGSSKVTISRQPSEEKIKWFNEFLAKKAIEIENKKIKEMQSDE